MRTATILLIATLTLSFQVDGVSQGIKDLKDSAKYKELLSIRYDMRAKGSSLSEYPRNVKVLSRTRYDRNNDIFFEKDYCCPQQVRLYKKKYNNDWQLLEQHLYRIHNNGLDTIIESNTKYTYDRAGKLLRISEYKYIEKDGRFDTVPATINEYIYNRKGQEKLHRKWIVENKDKVLSSYTKQYFDRKGRKRKEKYYSNILDENKPNFIAKTTYKYDKNSNQLLLEKIKWKTTDSKKIYSYEGEHLVSTITHEDDKIRYSYFIYEDGQKVRSEHYDEGKVGPYTIYAKNLIEN